jgi:hypothetical protein
MIADGRSIPPEDDRSNYLEQVMLKRSHQNHDNLIKTQSKVLKLRTCSMLNNIFNRINHVLWV